jgi:hypothetical protein
MFDNIRISSANKKGHLAVTPPVAFSNRFESASGGAGKQAQGAEAKFQNAGSK